MRLRSLLGGGLAAASVFLFTGAAFLTAVPAEDPLLPPLPPPPRPRPAPRPELAAAAAAAAAALAGDAGRAPPAGAALDDSSEGETSKRQVQAGPNRTARGPPIHVLHSHRKRKFNTPTIRGIPPPIPFVQYSGPDPSCVNITNAVPGVDAGAEWRAGEGLPECRAAGAVLHPMCLHGVKLPVANATLSETYWFSAHEALTLGHALQLLPGAEPGARPVFLDIGMNLGVFSLLVAAAAPWLDVWAYEPQPACAQLARCSAAAAGSSARVTVHNAYADSGSATDPPPVPRQGCDPEFSQRRKRREGGGEVAIAVADVAGAVGRRKLSGVKVDVEGAELGVLERLLPLLASPEQRPPFVLAELSPQWWPRGQRARCTALVGRLMDAGYAPHWYRVYEWMLRVVPPRTPWKPPWKRIGTRYGQSLHRLDDPEGTCSRAYLEGRVDVLFLRRELLNSTVEDYCADCFGCQVELPRYRQGEVAKSIPFNMSRIHDCANAVLHDGYPCKSCGVLRRPDARPSRAAVWVKYEQIPPPMRYIAEAWYPTYRKRREHSERHGFTF